VARRIVLDFTETYRQTYRDLPEPKHSSKSVDPSLPLKLGRHCASVSSTRMGGQLLISLAMIYKYLYAQPWLISP